MQMQKNKNWYIFHVQGGKELYLKKMINRCDEVVAFVPMMERKYKIKGVSQICIQPMFKGYLFIKTDKDQGYVQQLFLENRMKMRGLKKLLTCDEEGTLVLYKEEIAFLDKILDEDYILRISRGVIINDVIIVEEGPLKGLEKDIKKINRHTCMANLYVRILQKEVQAGLEITKKNEYPRN